MDLKDVFGKNAVCGRYYVHDRRPDFSSQCGHHWHCGIGNWFNNANWPSPGVDVGPDGGNLLGAGGIEYYIPLSGSNGTYGVSNYGLNPDFGNGGPTEKMFLYFSPVSGNSVLTIKFQDLDLVGANDPSGFFESLQIFGQGGNPLTPVITSLGSFLNGNVSGDHSAQLLTLALGVVSGPLYLELDFHAHSDSNGTNTAEYLLATVSPVPLPGALVLFGSGLVGLGFVARRRKVNISA